MRGSLRNLFLFLIVLSIPLAIGANITDEFILANETTVETVLLDEILSENSTTDFDEFLDKEYGVYYELLDDEDSNEITAGFADTSSTFTEGSDVIVITDNLTDFDSIYISVDEFTSGVDENETIVLTPSESLGIKIQDDIAITFGEIVQSPLVDNANVAWTQLITLTNTGDANDITLNLWSHDDILDRSFLWDIVKVSMDVDGEQISQTPIGIISLGVGETKTVTVSFETPAVIVTKNCFDVTVADLLPSDATIIESSIDLTTVVESICTGSIEYPSGSRFKEVSFI